jgi:hypothetical protein
MFLLMVMILRNNLTEGDTSWNLKWGTAVYRGIHVFIVQVEKDAFLLMRVKDDGAHLYNFFSVCLCVDSIALGISCSSYTTP